MDVQIKSDPESELLLPEHVEVKIEENDPLLIQYQNECEESWNSLETCGSVDLGINNDGIKLYRLKCNTCGANFLLSQWESFVEHLEKNHQQPLENTVKSPISDNFGDENGPENEIEYRLESKGQATEKTASSCDIKDGTGINGSDDNSEDDNESQPEHKKRMQDTAIISFAHKDENCVKDLLELIAIHPVLWLRRKSVIKRFDAALAETVVKFNTKWPQYSLTEDQMRNTIYRMKYRYMKDSSFESRYPNYFNLCKNLDIKSKKDGTRCKLCGIVFVNEINFQIHSFREHNIGELPFKCEKCKRTFESKTKLTSHTKNAHSDKELTCQFCPKSFKDEKLLFKHTTQHTGKRFVCETCGKNFDNAYSFRRHKLHHEPPKEKCEICGKMLFEKFTLSEHMKSHRNERQYKCDICGKTFNRTNGLFIHKKTHKIPNDGKQKIWTNQL